MAATQGAAATEDGPARIASRFLLHGHALREVARLIHARAARPSRREPDCIAQLRNESALRVFREASLEEAPDPLLQLLCEIDQGGAFGRG